MDWNRLWSTKAFIAVAIVAFIVSVASVCLILVKSATGEAAGNMGKDKTREIALLEAKKFSPETVAIEDAEEYSTEYEASYILKNEKGKNIGMIAVDRSTGKVGFFFDASEKTGKRQSRIVKIGKEAAAEKVKSFLKAQGIELDNYVLESDPLVCVGMEGPPENPIPAYSYEFNYRMQVNGIFVDDNESGNGALTITLSPEDGSIKSFALPKKSIKLADLRIDKTNIGGKEAIEIASEEVKGREILEGTAPVVQTDSVELRYMLMGSSRLVPYWKVTIRYRMDDLADVKDVPEEARYMGGCIYSVSAVDGEILSEGSF